VNPPQLGRYSLFTRVPAGGNRTHFAYVTSDLDVHGQVEVSVSAGESWTHMGAVPLATLSALYEHRGTVEPDPKELDPVRPAQSLEELRRVAPPDERARTQPGVQAARPRTTYANTAPGRGSAEHFEQHYANRLVVVDPLSSVRPTVFVAVALDDRFRAMLVRPVQSIAAGQQQNRLLIVRPTVAIPYRSLNPTVRKQRILVVDPPLVLPDSDVYLDSKREQAVLLGQYVFRKPAESRPWSNEHALRLDATDPGQMISALGAPHLASLLKTGFSVPGEGRRSGAFPALP
jgi:hypothetical protein